MQVLQMIFERLEGTTKSVADVGLTNKKSETVHGGQPHAWRGEAITRARAPRLDHSQPDGPRHRLVVLR